MHQIQRHRLTIDCSSSAFGKEVQLVVADLMEKEFYPKLELLLDQYPTVDATWVIDSIQITLPSVSKKNWKKELVFHALHQIEAFLNENFKNINTIDNSDHTTSSTTLLQNQQLAAFLFFDYLKTGRFNRSSLFNSVLDIEKQLAATTFKNNEKMHGFCNELVNFLLEHPKSLIRFIYTISTPTKTTIRNEKIGFLFDIEAVIKNEKPAKKFFSSSHEYSNWIQLLEWSLYFYKRHNANDVIHRFVASSLVDFQLNVTEINRFLAFLIDSSKGKITKEEHDIVFSFTEKIKAFHTVEANFITAASNQNSESSGEVDFKKATDNQINESAGEVDFKTAADNKINESRGEDNFKITANNQSTEYTNEGDFKTVADTSSKSETDEEPISLKNNSFKKELHDEALERNNSKSEANENGSDALANSLYSLDAKDKKEVNATNEATVTNSKQSNSELLQNSEANPNPVNKVEGNVTAGNSIDDASSFTTENAKASESVDAYSDSDNDLQDTSKISKENFRQNDNEEAKFNYRRFNLEEDTNAISTASDETVAKSKITIENPIYIENAGLIILHPFLIHLFEQLKLCKNDEWTSKRNQHKAVLISQYLITGSSIFFENDLVLNKILCGLEAEAVIDLTIKLSAKDKKEAKGLLEAVIGYWKALKSTSIDGLRETFLQRNGKLLMNNETTIELWVEQKGFDVLMAQIPWGIGMIKTPWMNRFMECNWN